MKKRSGIKKEIHMQKPDKIPVKLLWSYLVIIMAPAIAILVIYSTMRNALLDVQQEKAINLLAESASTMDRELDQIVHVVGQVAEDIRVRNYLESADKLTGAESYYQSYELAVNYTDYRLTNQFIKNIYVFPENGEYILQFPHVIPNTKRGWETVKMLMEQNNYETLMNNLELTDNTRIQGLFCLKKQGDGSGLVMFQEVLDKDSGERVGVVMAELEEKLTLSLLDRTLNGDQGIAYLADHRDHILLLSDQLENQEASWYGLTSEEYLTSQGWEKDKFTVVTESLDYNQWKLVCCITNAAMSNRIGMIRYGILLLCALSILIGIGICMKYWWNSWPVIKRYEKIESKYGTRNMSGGMNGVWKRFGTVIDRMEELEKTVEQQARWARAGILRKLLYGTYDTEQELEAEASRMGIDLFLEFPCLVAVMKTGESMGQELIQTEEEIDIRLREHLENSLPQGSQVVKTEFRTYALLLPELTDAAEVRKMFEEINYEFYSRIPIGIYMGIGGIASDMPEISGEFEKASSCCEYAVYHKIRIPMLPEDVPETRYMVFTVDMEIRLEKMIRSGSVEQLKQLVGQIHENYFQHGRQKRHNLEVVRCIVLRCLDEEPEGKKGGLLERIRQAEHPEEMEACIFAVCQYFEQRRLQDEDQEEIRLKERLEQKISEEYPRQDFNLANLSDWAGVSEKKLYRDFKKMFGVSFSSYLEMLRLRQAQKLLQEGNPVQDVAVAVGYGSDYSFRRAFKRVMGVSPSEYQKLQ